MLYCFSFLKFIIKNLMIKIVERDKVVIKEVIRNNKFVINKVVTIFSTDRNGTLDISLLFLYCGGTQRRYYSYARAAFFFLLKNIIKVKQFSVDFHYGYI